MGAAELSFVVKAIDQASGTLDHVNGKVGGLKGGLSKLGGLAGGALIGGIGVATAALGGLSVVLKQSFDAASEAEDIQAQLNATLESTGSIAGVTADAINEQALALSKVTKFEDDAIVAADALLLTFTKVGKDIFPDATEAILDVAQAMNMDLKSATMLVGKALNDPEKGMTALTRAGIQFTQSQKDAIAAMIETGNVAGAQQIILKELETQFGGSAVAAGKTFSGQMEILKNQLGNVKEQIGGALLPVVTEMLTKFGPGFVDAAGKFADWFVNKGLPALQTFGRFIEANVFPVLKTLGEWLSINVPLAIATLKQAWIDIQPTVQFIATIFQGVASVLSQVWDWMANSLPGAADELGRVFQVVGAVIEGIISAIRAVIDAAKTAIDWLNQLASKNAAAGGVAAGAGVAGLGNPAMGGGGYGTTPATAGGGGYTNRGPAMPVTININAPGGNPAAVAKAAQQGVLAAARSMGIR